MLLKNFNNLPKKYSQKKYIKEMYTCILYTSEIGLYRKILNTS